MKYSVLFYLRDTGRKDGMHLITLRVSFPQNEKLPNGTYQTPKRFSKSTSLLALPNSWNKKLQRVNRQQSNSVIINSKLNKILSEIETYISHAEAINSEPYSFLMQKFHSEPIKPKLTFFQFAEDYLKARAVTQQEKSLKEHRTVLSNLRDFCKEYGGTIDFNEFTYDFLNKFVSYLFTTLKNTNPTVEKKITHLKIFLNAAIERGIEFPGDYKKFKIDLPYEQRDVALTENELFKLYSLNLDHSERLAKARDIFCFLCFSGLRFSDYLAFNQDVHLIKAEDEQGHSFQAIKLIMKKTSRPVTFPLIPQAAEIVKRYNGELPKITNQKLNEYIKELCKMAGISQKIEDVVFRGSEKTTEHYPKHELISSHCGRRTWATTSFRRGISLETIRRCLGHASIQQTAEYLRLNELDYANEVLDAYKGFGQQKALK